MTAARDLLRQASAGLRTLLVLTVILGFAYPALLLAVGLVVPDRAGGSMIEVTGEPAGSSLIGQAFEGDQWFLLRPSVAGDGYDPQASGGSNLGPNSEELLKTVRERTAQVAEREGVPSSQVPPDAVTASASGLDPDISPAYAALRVSPVAGPAGSRCRRSPRWSPGAPPAETQGRQVLRGDEPVRSTPTEWNLLAELARAVGSVVGRRELLQALRGQHLDRATHCLRVYVAQLPRKLEVDPASPRHLITEPGMGYRFVP